MNSSKYAKLPGRQSEGTLGVRFNHAAFKKHRMVFYLQPWFDEVRIVLAAAGIPIRQGKYGGSFTKVMVNDCLVITEHCSEDDPLQFVEECYVDGGRHTIRRQHIVPGAQKV